jgi:hypothetical protein
MKIDTLQLEKYIVYYIHSKPKRLEANLIFERDHISQKLIFSLMDITFKHGFGFSPPVFKCLEDKNMTFLIGSVVSSSHALPAQLKRLEICLNDLNVFSQDFLKQLDFSTLDISMFEGVEVGDVEKVAAIRDQYYNGSWEHFYDVMKNGGFDEAAEITLRLKRFEEVNNKNIGLIGHKLNYVLDTLYLSKNNKKVFN